MVYQPYFSQPPGTYLSYPYGQVDFDFQQTNGQFICGGNILPFRFVTLEETGTIRQSIVGDWPIAVSPQNTQTYATPYAGTLGNPLETFGHGFDCWIELGGTVEAGNYLVPDSQGRAAAGSPLDYYAAKAYQGGTVGQLIRVKVLRLPPFSRECYSDWSFEFDADYGNDCGGVQP